MTKKKKETRLNFSSSFGVSDELHLIALREKNKKLAQTLATLQQDKARQQHEMNTLQIDYHRLQSKFLSLQNITTSLDTKMKECLPLLLNVVNMFTQLIHVSNAGAALCNSTQNKSDDTKTQTVKPQIVNGHVLHNPTINISRLNGNEADAVFGQTIQGMSQINQQKQSTSIRQSQAEEQSQTPNSEDSDSEEEELPNRLRRNAILVTGDPTNTTENDTADDMASDNEEDEQNDEEQSDDEEVNYNRLMTVLEEDGENSNNVPSQDVWRDVRVLLSQLPMESNTKENQTLLASQSVNNESKTSLICQTNNSVLENGALLDEMMSVTCGTSRDASGWSSSGQSPLKKVCMIRGGSGPKTGNSSTSSDSTLCLITDNRTIQKSGSEERGLSSINNPDSNGESFKKIDCMKRLGLEPNWVTSTPVIQQSPRTRSSRKSLELLDTSKSPVNKVTKRRRSGSGSNNSLAKVVLQQTRLEKRLSGSPIKKIGSVLDIVPITRSSDIKRSNKRKPICKIDSSDAESGHNERNIGDTEVVIKIEKLDSKKMNKGKENEDHSSPDSAAKMERPKRAARPSKPLVEPSLVRKMRRNK